MRQRNRLRGKRAMKMPVHKQELFYQADQDYIDSARRSMLQLLQTQKYVTIDDVYKHYAPPEYINRNTIMRRIFMHPDFRRVASRPTKRTGAQGRYVGVYELAQAAQIHRALLESDCA